MIAWDGHTLAADRQSTSGSAQQSNTKIFRVGMSLVGVSGDVGFTDQMVEWYRAGAVKADFPASQRDASDWAPMVVIRPGPIVLFYSRTPYPTHFEGRFFAMGSGRDFALAAMHLGKSAFEAVEVACALDPNCGNGWDTLQFVSGPP